MARLLFEATVGRIGAVRVLEGISNGLARIRHAVNGRIRQVASEKAPLPAIDSCDAGERLAPAVLLSETPWRDIAAVRNGIPRRILPYDGNEDVPQLVWDSGPIEMMFVDCGRLYQTNQAWYRIFSPSFIPDVTLIAMQDWRLQSEVPAYWEDQTKNFTDSKGAALQLDRPRIAGARGPGSLELRPGTLLAEAALFWGAPRSTCVPRSPATASGRMEPARPAPWPWSGSLWRARSARRRPAPRRSPGPVWPCGCWLPGRTGSTGTAPAVPGARLRRGSAKGRGPPGRRRGRERSRSFRS